MKLSQILGKDKITLSFEVFPPKTEANYAVSYTHLRAHET